MLTRIKDYLEKIFSENELRIFLVAVFVIIFIWPFFSSMGGVFTGSLYIYFFSAWFVLILVLFLYSLFLNK